MKIISCRESVKRIFETLEGELESLKKKELDQHLGKCRECCNRWEFEKLLKEKLQALNSRKRIPKRFERRIDGLLKSF